jgi:homocysteine S-methyltransferase
MNYLPQLDRIFLTDGGLETDMIFNRGVELRSFAAIDLLATAFGRQALDRYFREYLDLARTHGSGFVLESPTWRASQDWAEALGLTPEELDERNAEAIGLLHALRLEYSPLGVPAVISSCVGPRGDGYDPGEIMTADEAFAYHRRQVAALASAGPDMISAITMTNVPEAIGVAKAASSVQLPAVISFTVETDGRLPTGDTLGSAIEQVDAATGGYPAYFMVNCAHPTHFADVLAGGGAWTKRVRGIRANASRCSHAELDNATELDIGDPHELGRLYRDLRTTLPGLNVLGGCCGTDIRHLVEIALACVVSEQEAA